MQDTIEIRKAQRSRVSLKIGLSGPSGYGKTAGALLIAYGMTGDWEKILVIDTENGSASLYAGSRIGEVEIGEFDTITLAPDYTPEKYIAAIAAAERAGKYEVLIVDSATHEWDGKGGCLEIVDSLGGKYQDWAKVTPRHRRFIDAILQTPLHFITTVRTKQDYAIETKDGKTKVTKLGMKEVQREGMEYELTVNFNLTNDHHLAKASKDRTGLFMNRPEFVITPDLGREIVEWNKSGKTPAPDHTVAKQRIATELSRLKINPKTMPDFKDRVRAITGIEWTDDNLNLIATALQNADGSLDVTDSHDEPPLPPPTAPATNAAPAPTPIERKAAAVAAYASLFVEAVTKLQCDEILAASIGDTNVPMDAGDEITALHATRVAYLNGVTTTKAPAAEEMEAAKGRMAVLNEYREQFKAAQTEKEVDDIDAMANSLDKNVTGSPMLRAAVRGLATDRRREITATTKAPELVHAEEEVQLEPAV